MSVERLKLLFKGGKPKVQGEKAVSVAIVQEERLSKNDILGFLQRMKGQGFGLGSWHAIRAEDIEIVELLEKHCLVNVDVGRKNVRIADGFYGCARCKFFLARAGAYEYNRCAWSKRNLSQMLNPQHGRSCSGFAYKTVDGILKELK